MHLVPKRASFAYKQDETQNLINGFCTHQKRRQFVCLCVSVCVLSILCVLHCSSARQGLESKKWLAELGYEIGGLTACVMYKDGKR